MTKIKIGLIKEGKSCKDNRVAFTPKQCLELQVQYPHVKVFIQKSEIRCFSDAEYQKLGLPVVDDISHCDILLGIKEVPIEQLIPNKTYFIFSHTKKMQPYNQDFFKAMIAKKITLIDYECIEYTDGSRVLGFGFFAGIVGAHNGLMAYGLRTNTFHLERVFKVKDYSHLISSYFGLKLPPIKIAVTGSGRVSKGIIEIMNLIDIKEVDDYDYCNTDFDYPVFIHLKGDSLYQRKDQKPFIRTDFHNNPKDYKCLFNNYLPYTQILLNGVYWEKSIAPLFTLDDLNQCKPMKLVTIADVTDDAYGSVPCNLGDATIEDPIYGFDVKTGSKTLPYQSEGIDIVAVGNLPNELPRDASYYFGEQLLKNVIPNIFIENSPIINKATILKNGNITINFEYLKNYCK